MGWTRNYSGHPMAEDPEEESDEAPKKKSKLPLIIGVVLALVGGGGSFFAIYSGMLFGTQDEAGHTPAEDVAMEIGPDVDFVPIEPMTISLGPAADNRHLRFRAQLEVPSANRTRVTDLLPRVVDVLNSYLRALDIADLEDPTALTRLRAQMLRRVQVVTGPGLVSDLLVMEFVMN